MAINSLSDRVKPIDQPTRNTNLESDVRSYDLVLYRYLLKVNEMICLIRDRATGITKRAFGSQLKIYWPGAEKYKKGITLNFGKDAYLLELTATGGTQ